MKPIPISGELFDPAKVAESVGMSKREYQRIADFVERSLREGVYEFPPRRMSPRKKPVVAAGATTRRLAKPR